MKTLRLILGDQLNYKHSWYSETSKDVVYFLAEMRQETDYVKHHIQKVVAFFESMEQFANWLRCEGHDVIHYKLDHEDNRQDLSENIRNLIEKHQFGRFE